jgi:hypothetical protein
MTVLNTTLLTSADSSAPTQEHALEKPHRPEHTPPSCPRCKIGTLILIETVKRGRSP